MIPLLVPLGQLPSGDPIPQSVRDCYGSQTTEYTQTPRLSAAQLRTLLTTDVNLSGLYRSASYGKTRLSFTVLENPAHALGWWPAPHTLVDYCRRLPDLFRTAGTMVHDAVTRIYQDAVDRGFPSTFRRVAVLVNHLGHGGQGTPRAVYPFTVRGKRSSETFTAALWNLGPNDTRLVSVLRHELGHELGLPDQYLLDNPCPAYPGARDPWWNRACVGPWDPMGSSEFGAEFSGWSRVQLAWLYGGPGEGNVLTLPQLLVPPPSPRTWTLDLAPLEATAAEIDTHTTMLKPRLLQIPVLLGREYDVECRKRLAFDRVRVNDDPLLGIAQLGIPDEGVVVYEVDESRASPLIVQRPRPGDLLTAPLRVGESVTLDAFRSEIELLRLPDTTRSGVPYCRLSVTVSAHELTPVVNVSFGSQIVALAGRAPAPDVWLDSPANGLGTYPQLQQVVHQDGVDAPVGPGDQPAAGRGNLVWFRLFNGGDGEAHDVRVSVFDSATPVDGCSRAERLIETVTIPSLGPGELALRSVRWTPDSATGRIIVRARAGGDVFPADDSAALDYAAGVTLRRGRATATLQLPAAFGCANPEQLAIVPLGLPQGWLVSQRPKVIGPETETVAITVRGQSAPRPVLLAFVGQDAGHPFELGHDRPVGFLTVLRGTARPSTLTASCDDGGRVGERSFSVAGRISPAHAGATIELGVAAPSGAVFSQTVLARPDGTYSIGFLPTEAGTWTAFTRWYGDDDHLPARSGTCTFEAEPPAQVEAEPSAVSLECPPVAMLGLPLELAGRIDPPHGGADVTLTYTSPEGGGAASLVTTSPDGTFADSSFAPDALGDWVVGASWAGDGDHLGASASCTIFVTTVFRPGGRRA